MRNDVDTLFGPGGGLARGRSAFEFRAGQQKMAAAVDAAFTSRRHLVVEAGTGTGKTLAYLVPALLADEPVVISTGTKALQDQVVTRELPLALAATGLEREVAVLKGRENYLCRKRLSEMEAEPLLELASEGPLWDAIVAWSHETEAGDRAEIPELRDQSPLWSKLDGRADICTREACPHYDRCFVYAARRRAARAQIVVVNHHLLFADLALRRARRGQLLPPVPYLVLDEAHLAEEAAIQHFGTKVSGRMLIDFGTDAETELKRAGEDAHAAKSVARVARVLFRELRPRFDRRLPFRYGDVGAGAVAQVEALEDDLDRIASLLGGPGEREHERALVVARSIALRNALSDLAGPTPAGHVVTVEPQGKDGSMVATWPIDVATLMSETLGENFESVVATSATLAIGTSLERARRSLGLEPAETLLVRSPFDHRRQAALYVPRSFPDPGTPAYGERCLREIEELLRISDGRALVLFASHRALREAAEALRHSLPWPVLVQGEAPREQLVERFRSDVHSVLLGTASFRQGIDVPGEALSLVIVDKLPFAVPDDPLVAARAELIRERGGDPFNEDQLPEAILALKQGLGRLIRTRADRGLLALLDVRVRTRRYGQVVLGSLPEWPLLDDLDQARSWWRQRIG